MPIVIRDPRGTGTLSGAGAESEGAPPIEWLLEDSPTASPTLIGSLRFMMSASPPKPVGRWVSMMNFTFSFPFTPPGPGGSARSTPAIRFS